MENALERAVFTVVILVLVLVFALLPLLREKRKKERDRKYTQSLAHQHLARSRHIEMGNASGRSNVPTKTPVLFASGDTKGGDTNDTIT